MQTSLCEFLDYRALVYDVNQRSYSFPGLLLAQLHLGNTRIAIPAFASHWVKFAQALVVLNDSGPVRVLRVDTEALPFNTQGLVIRSALEPRIAANLRPADTCLASNIVQARDRFELGRLNWTPTGAELSRLRRIFLEEEEVEDFPLAQFIDQEPGAS
jgi:hypothetical protein